jgi:hypothetical protein
MNIDTGFAVVILAVLVFYLRLIVIQRQRAKQLRSAAPPASKKKSSKSMPAAAPQRYSVLSPRKSDWLIAGIGVVLLIAGVLLYAGFIPWPLGEEYWWVPTATGIVLFSWAFRL